MAALVLRERHQGRSSTVWGYITQLPPTIDTPARWTDAELEQLQYSLAANKVKEQRQRLKEAHARFATATEGREGASVSSWDDFIWAAEAVRSRAFSGPYAGAPPAERARGAAIVGLVGTAYVAWQHLPLQQALNGAMAAAVFNVVYDLLLSSKAKWYAMCPVIDLVNHSSRVEVGGQRQLVYILYICLYLELLSLMAFLFLF
jgi:hypothetical protein